VEIEKSCKCVKLKLPNNKVVDVLSPVLNEMYQWIQDADGKPESGGYIVGYQHKETGHISLETVSHPYTLDTKSRIRFNIKDPRHILFLKKAERNNSYYMGVWHTHPQMIPCPSSIDWKDWTDSLKKEKTGCEYIFFVIVGIKEWRVWVGNLKNGIITEIFECEKGNDGLYK
jgi:integrative and conjugative element protein (TIGR02256 family)